MEQDWLLLRQYLDNRSQTAFRKIVDRYSNLVYATCLREAGDAQLAEDAAQVVFLLLAKKAPSFKRDIILSSWLFKASRFTARDMLRREKRRSMNEQRLSQEAAMEHNANEPVWQSLEPVLNQSLAGLNDLDRAAILLRYFEGHSHVAIGDALGISSDAAQKRVSRALDRLRKAFHKHGVTITVSTLSAILAENSTRSCPAEPLAFTQQMTEAIASGHLETHLAGNPAYHHLQGVLKTMKIVQIKTAAAVVMGVAAIGGVGGVGIHTSFGASTSKQGIGPSKIAPDTATTALPAIAKIDIKGNSLVSTDQITAVMSQKVGGNYSPDSAKKDQAAIKAMGFFNGAVKLDAVADKDGGEDLTYTIKENPLIKKIVITANTPSKQPDISADDLRAHMSTKEGEILNTTKLNHDLDTLFNRSTGYVRTKGYIIDFSPEMNIEPNTGVLTIPLIETHVAAIKITGNKKVSTATITRILGIKPGDTFNTKTMQAATTRLFNSGSFSEIGPFVLQTVDLGKSNLELPVVEK